MSKPKDLSYFEGKWWIRDGLWDNIGKDVTSRPTEEQALANINLQSKYIRKLSKWELALTPQELLVFNTDRLIHSRDFDTDNYKELKVYKKDLTITKISKITGFSLEYTRKLLKNISYKSYLAEVLGIELFVIDNNKNNTLSNNNYYKQKKNKYYNKLSKYKKYKSKESKTSK